MGLTGVFKLAHVKKTLKTLKNRKNLKTPLKTLKTFKHIKKPIKTLKNLEPPFKKTDRARVHGTR